MDNYPAAVYKEPKPRLKVRGERQQDPELLGGEIPTHLRPTNQHPHREYVKRHLDPQAGRFA